MEKNPSRSYPALKMNMSQQSDDSMWDSMPKRTINQNPEDDQYKSRIKMNVASP